MNKNRTFPVPVHAGPPIVDEWHTYEGELVIDYGGMGRWVGVYLPMRDGNRLLIESWSVMDAPWPAAISALVNIVEQQATQLEGPPE